MVRSETSGYRPERRSVHGGRARTPASTCRCRRNQRGRAAPEIVSAAGGATCGARSDGLSDRRAWEGRGSYPGVARGARPFVVRNRLRPRRPHRVLGVHAAQRRMTSASASSSGDVGGIAHAAIPPRSRGARRAAARAARSRAPRRLGRRRRGTKAALPRMGRTSASKDGAGEPQPAGAAREQPAWTGVATRAGGTGALATAPGFGAACAHAATQTATTGAISPERDLLDRLRPISLRDRAPAEAVVGARRVPGQRAPSSARSPGPAAGR